METVDTTKNQTTSEYNETANQNQSVVSKRNSLEWVVFVIMLMVLAVLVGFVYIKNGKILTTTKNLKNESTTVTPTTLKPTPIPLHPGPETYTVSQSKHEGPVFSKVMFDPLDVKKGQTLTVTVSIANALPVNFVKGSLTMDSSASDLSFEQISGDAKSGIWEAKITLNDSVDYIYKLKVSAEAKNGSSSITVTPR